jgi:hypothetical protein
LLYSLQQKQKGAFIQTNFFRQLFVLAIIAMTTQSLMASDLDRLKPFRSYYQVELESTTAEQFEVWYETDGNGWDTFHLAVQDNEVLTSLPEERRLDPHVAFAGWPRPPKHLSPAPAKLKSLVEQIKNLIPSTFSDKIIKDIKVSYMGRSARAVILQYIPASVYDPADKYRSGSVSERYYLVNTKKGTLQRFGGGSGGGSNMYNSTSGKFPTSWLNLTLPRNIEGSPVLDLMFYQEPGQIPWCIEKTLKGQESRLMSAIVKRVREMEQGTGLTSEQILNKVLAAQESTVLPQQVKQTLTFDFSIYGRIKLGNQLDGRLNLKFPATMTPTTVTEIDPVTGVEISATLDLTAQTLVIQASRDGNILSKSTALKYVELLVDGSQMMAQGSMYADGEIDMSLPGAGDVRSFDIYPGQISPANFLTPLNVPNCN